MNTKHSNLEASEFTKKSRIKKSKPLSMNETLLNKIVKDSIGVGVSAKKINNCRNGVPISTGRSNVLNRTTDHTDHEVTQTHTNSVNVNLMTIGSSGSLGKSTRGTSNPSTQQIPPKSSLKQSLNKSSSVVNKKITKVNLNLTNSSHASNITNDVPIPTNKNLNKNPSNGLDTISSAGQHCRGHLKTEQSLSSVNTERDFHQSGYLKTHTFSQHHPHSQSNLMNMNSHTSFKTDSFKLNEELLEYKLNNSKLKNEINILNEKMKTLKQVINMKNNENDLIKTKYSDMIEEYKKEIEKMKKVSSEYKSVGDIVNKQNISLKSALGILIDLMEIFIAPRSGYANTNNTNTNILTRQSIVDNISASYSIDIYDSYHNDEERRTTMIEQIQGLLVSKLNVMKKNLGLDLDKEIERIKAWNIRPSYIYNNEVSISNLKISKQNESSESLRKSTSNDFFDLSTSNHLLGQSPKFNSVELYQDKQSEMYNNINKELDIDPEQMHNFSLNKKMDDENQLLNDSFLKDLKQNDSFSDDRNGSLIQITAPSNMNTAERKMKDNNFEMNILDCSIIDLNVDNMIPKQITKENKMLLNDDPTEFNMEIHSIHGNNTPEIGKDLDKRDREKEKMNYLSLQGDQEYFIDGGETENYINGNNALQSDAPVILDPIINTNLLTHNTSFK